MKKFNADRRNLCRFVLSLPLAVAAGTVLAIENKAKEKPLEVHSRPVILSSSTGSIVCIDCWVVGSDGRKYPAGPRPQSSMFYSA